MKKNERIIECIHSDNLREHKEKISRYIKKNTQKKVAIFGAGIMGMQFAILLLQERPQVNCVFVDNSSDKWNSYICGIRCIHPKDIEGKNDEYFVFLAMENYKECLKQLEGMGFVEHVDLELLGNISEKRLYNEMISKANECKCLMLGDCAACTVSMFEHEQESISDFFSGNMNVSVLALNGLYMRSYYALYLMRRKYVSKINKVIILLGMDVLGKKVPFFPKNQHFDLMNKIYKSKVFGEEEIDSFIEICKERENQKIGIDFGSPDRTVGISEEKILVGKRNHLRLNLLYNIEETSENVQYIDKMCNEARKSGVDVWFVIMPVNFEECENLVSEEFRKVYDNNVSVVKKHVINNGGKVCDLSYLLGKNDFISIRSTNEGIYDSGRKKVIEKVSAIVNMGER